MKPELILIANASQARLFTRQSDHEPLVPLATFEHPEGHLAAGELSHDRLGHDRKGRRPGGVSFAPRTDPRRKKHLQFARRLAQQIDAAPAAGQCGRVTVFASCPFLGEIKGQLGRAAKQALRAAIVADLTHCSPGELQQRVDRELHDERAALA